MNHMFEWKKEFSVGIASIDGQHQNLFAIGRELYAAMSAGQGKEKVGRILERLIQYASVHFAHEERLLQQCNYPAYEAHKKEHEALTKRVLAFQAEYNSGAVAMTIQVLQFMKNWLEHHILEQDRAYAPCLAAKAQG